MKACLRLLAGVALMCPAMAMAQRTSENLVTQSADAFGKTIGSEKIGLYNAEDVRGFNPVDAGNVRIEGLYFDHVERVPARIVEGSTVRVGLSVQGVPFPAPTGIVDYSLTLYEGKSILSGMVERGPFGGVAGNLELRLPLAGEKLGIDGGFGFREQVRPEGGRNGFRSYGGSVVWRPTGAAMFTVFAGAFTNRGDEARVTIFPAAGEDLPNVPRGQFLGQSWTDRNGMGTTFGGIGKLAKGPWLFEAGLFEFRTHSETNFADLLRGVKADGSASSRTIIYDPDSETRSFSGEGRVTRLFRMGAVEHRIIVSARGRVKDRLFGGVQRIDLGPSSAITPDFQAKPVLLPQVKDEDHVQQMNWGLAYGFKWLDRGSVDLSVSHTSYTKKLDFADVRLPVLETRDNPILVTAAGSVRLNRHLSLYGGYVRGLEEALIAPDVATNRSEAPPAIRTRQIDFGLRYGVTPKLTLVAGLFSVSKPYFNLDPSMRYRQLGQVDNRGLELSLAGAVAPGVTLVAGSLFLDPVISGEAVTAGLIGKQPVGSVRRRSIASIDWRFAGGTSPISIDVALESLSSRMANPLNTLVAPPRETINLGGRYRFKVDGHALLLRAQMLNLLNDYGWQVSSSGGFTYSSGRTYMAQLVFDI
jgi:iron complex outermembrane receptor protein